MALRIIASLLLLGCCGAVALDDDSVLLQVAFDSADPHNWQEDPKTLKIVDQAAKMAAGHMGKLDMDAIVAAIPKGVEVAQQLAQGLGLDIDMSKLGQLSAMAAPMAPIAAQMVEGPDGKLDMSKVAGLVKPVAEMAKAMGPEKIAEMVLGQVGFDLDDNSRKALASLKNVDLKDIDVMKYMGFANQAMQQMPKALPMVSKAVKIAQDSSKDQRRRMLFAVGEGRSNAQIAQLADQSMELALVSGNHVFSAVFRAARMIMPQLISAGIINKQDKSLLKDMTKVQHEVMTNIATIRTRVSDLSHVTNARSYQERAKLVHEVTAYAKMNAQLLKQKSHVLFQKLQQFIDQVTFVVPEEKLRQLKLEQPVRQLLDDYYPNEPETKESLTSWFNEEIKSQSEMFADAVDNFLANVISSMNYKQQVGPMM